MSSTVANKTSQPLPHLDQTIAVDQLHSATAIYTADAVVNSLLDKLDWPHEPGKLLDPSAGDGSFIIAALARLDLANNPHQIDRVRGWEIHSGAAADAKKRIAAYLETHGYTPSSARTAADTIIINNDFLTHGPTTDTFRFIAGNPPYLRFQRLPELFKQIYINHLPPHAKADILHAFIDACTHILPADGTIAIICSDRVLFNSNAKQLRERIGRTLGISHLARLDPSTSFYRPKTRVRNSPPRIHPVELILTPLSTGSSPIDGSPISLTDRGRSQHIGPTLKDIAKVSIAPWLGPRGIFVVTGELAQNLLDAGADLIPALDTDDINPDDTIRNLTLYAIRTSRNEHPVPAADNHLRKHRDRMPKRGQDRSYWTPPETINLPLNEPSLLIPRIAKRLRAIPLPPGILPINHNLSVISTGRASLEQIQNILLSPQSQHWIAENAPRLEGGYLSITTTLLRRLPVNPDYLATIPQPN